MPSEPALPDDNIPQSARDLLKAALALHADGDIDAALAEAQLAVEAAPAFADAHSYIGSTLITKKGDYTAGLDALAQAEHAAPDDATLHYTIGWCYEFVAHRVSRRPRPGLDPDELYHDAEHHLRRCLELNPDAKIRDDAKDLLSSIIKEDVP
jgi:tetratricopeptide (TPR) repeat protein